MSEVEDVTPDIVVDTSRLLAAFKALELAVWRAMRQRRTLRWRRSEDGTVRILVKIPVPRQPREARQRAATPREPSP